MVKASGSQVPVHWRVALALYRLSMQRSHYLWLFQKSYLSPNSAIFCVLEFFNLLRNEPISKLQLYGVKCQNVGWIKNHNYIVDPIVLLGLLKMR